MTLQCTKPFHHIDRWTQGGNRHGDELSLMTYPLKEFAKYYDIDPRIIGERGNRFNAPAYEWLDEDQGKYFKARPKSPTEAREAVENWEVPADIKAAAKTVSRRLVGAFFVAGGSTRTRRQTSGRLDMPRVISQYQDIAAGRKTVSGAGVYKRREHSAPIPPHIGIVGDSSFGRMWEDATYIPKVTALLLGVAWGCEAIQCRTTAALTREEGRGAHTMMATVLMEPGVRVQSNHLACVFSREMYRNGIHCANGAHQEGLQARMNRDKVSPMDTIESAGKGGPAISWLKDCRGADITVAVGSINDRKNADVSLKVDTDLNALAEKLGESLAATQRRKRAA